MHSDLIINVTSQPQKPNYMPLKNLDFVTKATKNLKVHASKAIAAFRCVCVCVCVFVSVSVCVCGVV